MRPPATILEQSKRSTKKARRSMMANLIFREAWAWGGLSGEGDGGGKREWTDTLFRELMMSLRNRNRNDGFRRREFWEWGG